MDYFKRTYLMLINTNMILATLESCVNIKDTKNGSNTHEKCIEYKRFHFEEYICENNNQSDPESFLSNFEYHENDDARIFNVEEDDYSKYLDFNTSSSSFTSTLKDSFMTLSDNMTDNCELFENDEKVSDYILEHKDNCVELSTIDQENAKVLNSAFCDVDLNLPSCSNSFLEFSNQMTNACNSIDNKDVYRKLLKRKTKL